MRKASSLSSSPTGLPIREARAVYKHALKNALIPIVTMLRVEVSVLLAGAILTETTFSWPGIGRLHLERINQRDYPIIQGIIGAGHLSACVLE